MTNKQILKDLAGIEATLFYRLDRDGLEGVSQEATEQMENLLRQAVKLWHEATGENL